MNKEERRRLADAERALAWELVDELAWLIEWSRPKFTDVNKRTEWIMRKQAVLRRIKAMEAHGVD